MYCWYSSEREQTSSSVHISLPGSARKCAEYVDFVTAGVAETNGGLFGADNLAVVELQTWLCKALERFPPALEAGA